MFYVTFGEPAQMLLRGKQANSHKFTAYVLLHCSDLFGFTSQIQNALNGSDFSLVVTIYSIAKLDYWRQKKKTGGGEM